jgi:hypothetical protein
MSPGRPSDIRPQWLEDRGPPRMLIRIERLAPFSWHEASRFVEQKVRALKLTEYVES